MEWVEADSENLPLVKVLAVNRKKSFMIGYLVAEENEHIYCNGDDGYCLNNVTHYCILTPPHDN